MRLLTLERLLHIDAVELNVALSQAATILAEILATDKIDIFLYEPSTTTLVSYGVSDTPMGQQQKALGLDRLPLANKGRVVEVFETGEPFCSAHLDEDPHELIGVKERLGIRSMMNVSLVVNGECRGVFSAVSA
ncbi:MAG: GAF domain-containing protein, partial [Chloroflexi bacterium]|nr:GAF domain-containing protein [Chloroflexota bacterium]